MAIKKTIKHSGIVAEVDEDVNEHLSIKKPQVPAPPEKYWTKSSLEAEELVKKGFKLLGVFSPYDELPKRWIFDATKEQILGGK